MRKTTIISIVLGCLYGALLSPLLSGYVPTFIILCVLLNVGTAFILANLMPEEKDE